MTTQILSEDISVYTGVKIVGGIALDLYFKNMGTATLDATIIFCLYQHYGLGNETVTNFQCWIRKGISPNDEINITGSYFLSEINLELILAELNNDPQTLGLLVEVTGGASESDRTALTKQVYTDVVDYSLFDSKY